MDTQNQNVFSKRLKAAREMRNMSMAALSTALGNAVTPQAIYKYEAGKMLPGAAVLLQLSKVLSVPVDYFFRPFEVSVDGIEFRKKSKLGVKERKSIENEAIDKIEKYVEIEDICGDKPMSRIPFGMQVKDESDVLALVDDIRIDWGLDGKPIGNVIALLESMGIIVIEINASKDFDGLSGRANDIPVIVLNTEFPSPERKRFTALHELGHLIMAFKPEEDVKHIESMCHLFASEMLLPTSLYKQEVGDISRRKLSLIEFASVQQKYGISIDALMYKAKEAGMISESRQRNYHILKNTRPSFKDFADKSRTAEESSTRFEQLVYKALDNELISISNASALLDMPAEQVMSNAKFV